MPTTLLNNQYLHVRLVFTKSSILSHVQTHESRKAQSNANVTNTMIKDFKNPELELTGISLRQTGTKQIEWL